MADSYTVGRKCSLLVAAGTEGTGLGSVGECVRGGAGSDKSGEVRQCDIGSRSVLNGGQGVDHAVLVGARPLAHRYALSTLGDLRLVSRTSGGLDLRVGLQKGVQNRGGARCVSSGVEVR